MLLELRRKSVAAPDYPLVASWRNTQPVLATSSEQGERCSEERHVAR